MYVITWLEDIRKFETLSVSDSSPYRHFNVLVRQEYKRPSPKERKRMMETVSVLKRSYETALSYRKKSHAGKLEWNDENGKE